MRRNKVVRKPTGFSHKSIFLTIIFLFLLAISCTQKQADAVSAVTAMRGPPAPTLLKSYMPRAMEDGIVKIAVLVHQKADDSSREFAEGCVSEGRSMGFTVDTFASGGDESRCREIAAGIAQADYDGLVFSNGFAGGIDGGAADFSYNTLKPVADTGIPIVTFEALPYQDSKSLANLTTTFQDDYSLARLSIETLLSAVHTGDGRPARVISIACEPGITFLDRRFWEFEQYIQEGKIVEAARITLNSLENPHGAAWEALAEILPHVPPYSVDALWVPWDEFAGGCAEALAAADRNDIKMISIGISNDDIRMMQRHPEIWIGNTAIDPKLAGTVNMRLLAAKLAGEYVQNTFSFIPQLVKTADLNHSVNLTNLSMIAPDWGDGKGLFDHYQWMIDIKAAEGKYLRIPPPSLSASTNTAAP